MERIQGSVPLVMVAFLWCYRVGTYLYQIGPTKIKKVEMGWSMTIFL